MKTEIPVLIGDYVFQGETTTKFDAKIVPDSGLDEIYKIIRKIQVPKTSSVLEFQECTK